jgi:uncharacterized protein YdgA (DUF945 family)
MKKWVGLVVILTTLILGGYYGMGSITERTLKKNIAMINQSNGLFVKVDSYKRGWFCSNALITWHFHLPARSITNQMGEPAVLPAQDFEMQIPLKIAHGPIIFADSHVRLGLGYAHSDMSLPKPYAEQFTQLFTAESTRPVLNFSIFVNYLNNSRLHLDLPKFTLISKKADHAEFKWLGMTSDLRISSNVNDIHGRVAIDGMRWARERVATDLGTVVSDYDLHKTKLGLYSGDADLLLSALRVSQGGEQTLSVEKLNLHSTSDVTDGLFNAQFKLMLNQLVFDGKTYGPVLLDFAVRHLDAGVLAKINDKANASAKEADVQRHQLLMMILPELPSLLSKGAAIELSQLSIGMSDGVAKASLLLSLPTGDAANPFQMIQKMQGKAVVELPKIILKNILMDAVKQELIKEQTAASAVVDLSSQALEKANEKLAAMEKSGLLSVRGDDYVITLVLADGHLVVNDKPFNSAMMQF